ncbi:transcription factor that binds to CRE motif [Lithohypha guttulata]|uniref:Transcription factor that binds to CRE motif n=1 Tax=Lithohypha guttulata TaxID=1690604 RepID=A0AAN7SVA5_9EURO|nr:transcription factor that binds to CRE motif [Lithohypha guttulata]
MDSYVDAAFLRQDSPFEEYPTPAASSDAETTVDSDLKPEPQKKKRKAWGQPVPEIVPILPPRKRAKTAEEKEQRKNERILRNRRAADKSRQRQKAAQAGLEQQNIDLLAENAQLKQLLQAHGLLDTFHFTAPSPSVDLSVKLEPEVPNTPVLSQPTPSSISEQDTPYLAPQLDMGQLTLSSATLPESAGFGEEASIIGTEFFGEYTFDPHSLPNSCDDILNSLNFNALVDPPSLPDFGAGIGNDYLTAGTDCPEQLSAATYFDFGAFDADTTSDFPNQTSQSTSGLQSQFSASLDDGRRQGFAAEID